MRISVYVPKVRWNWMFRRKYFNSLKTVYTRDIALTNWVHDQIEYLIEKREVKDEQLV